MRILIKISAIRFNPADNAVVALKALQPKDKKDNEI
jgi:hypothetical protein